MKPKRTSKQNNEYTLRRAGPDDIPYIYALRERTMKKQFAGTFGWNETQQRSMAEDHIDKTQIIMAKEQRIGVVKVLRENDRYLLHQIQVEPEYQGKGIGSHIISEFICLAEEEKLPFDLWVIKIAKAKTLYEKLGFKLIEEHEHNCLMRLSCDKRSQPAHGLYGENAG
jgi:N-acetylglutamate synthase-like GNAT family acetyltransferase